MKAEVCEVKEKSSVMGGRYKHNQQLEELRHLQERLGVEKAAWEQEREAMEQEMELKKKELARTQVRKNLPYRRVVLKEPFAIFFFTF